MCELGLLGRGKPGPLLVDCGALFLVGHGMEPVEEDARDEDALPDGDGAAASIRIISRSAANMGSWATPPWI